MASTINASTSPAAIIQTADGTANLSLQSNGTTIAALTSTGMAVTGTISASGVITATGGLVVGAAAAPAFSAYRQSSQSVTQNVFTKIALNTENFDTNNNFDSTTNYRFTPTVAGYYQFNALISLTGTVTTTQFVGVIAKNGSTILQRHFDVNPSASLSANAITNMTASELYYMNGSTDYVELYVYYYLGTSTISGSNGYQITILSGSMVRSA